MASFESQSQEKEKEKENGDGPFLCSNNCGFFGSSEKMNMCSVCYKDFVKKHKAEEGSSSMQMKTKQSVAELLKGKESEELLAMAKPSSRCSWCMKRVGLTGFKCRCGDTFCGVHRYAEQHKCPYDYRKEAREAIAKNNPLIKPDKVVKF